MIKLFINDELIDFQLEDEKTVEDLFNSLEAWAKTQKNVIVDFLIKDKSYFKNDDLKKLELKTIENLKLYVKKITHFCFEIIVDMEKHINDILYFIEQEKVYKKIDSLKESVFYLKSSINDLLAIYNDYDKSLLEDVRLLEIKVFEIEDKKDFKTNKEYLEEYKTILEKISGKMSILNFYSYVFYLIHEFKDNGFDREILCFFKENIEELIEKMFLAQVEISKNFQIGDDNKAISWLLPFIDSLSFINYIIEQIADLEKGTDEDVKQLQVSLKNSLEEIEESFKIKDYVSISDLIEYELKDHLDAFKSILEKKFKKD